MSSLGNPMS
jgi:hypothetical protein